MAWWKSPWRLAGVAVVPVVLLFIGVSMPGGYFDVLAAALVAWAAVGVAWLAACASCVADRRSPWPLLLVPVLFVASWAVASGDLVGRVMFPLHRPGLERLAKARAEAPQQVGLYGIEQIGRIGGCVLFATRDPGMARSAGFAWCPGRVPVDVNRGEGLVLEPFDGDWYVFHHQSSSSRPWGLRLGRLSKRVET